MVRQFNKHGHYTANSGYQVARSQFRAREGEEESSSGAEEAKKRRKALWSLGIKQKIEVFLWKCYHNSLPVKAELLRRRCQ